MEILKLKNGSKEVAPLVRAAMASINQMMSSGMDAMAVYELVEKCKDPNHELFGNAAEKLKQRNLLEASGSVHQSIRNVVLSAVEGEGWNMVIGNPVA